MDNYSVPLNTVFHAFSDPTRRAVIQRLSTGQASVTELAEPFEMALPSFMKHLRVLEASGLIKSEKAGRTRTCSLIPETLSVAETWLTEQRTLWEGRTDRLVAYTETLAAKETQE